MSKFEVFITCMLLANAASNILVYGALLDIVRLLRIGGVKNVT